MYNCTWLFRRKSYLCGLCFYVFSKKYHWKPKIAIRHKDFKEVKQSYHYNNDSYRKERLRSNIEIQISDIEISDGLLEDLNDLHNRYINGIDKLFKSGKDEIQTFIEAFYDETHIRKDKIIEVKYFF